MASPFERLTQAIEYLHSEHWGAEALNELESAKEEEVRAAFKFHGIRPPVFLEIKWASEKIAWQLMQGHKVVAFHPTGRFPLTWTVATKD